MILDDILEKRKEQLTGEKARLSLEEMKERAQAAPACGRSFSKSLQTERLAVIAEVKKASPSKGIIKADFQPVKIALEYQNAGANALSVLTEEHYFQGSSEYLSQISASVDIPILRKDFLFDPYQLYEAKAIGAHAVLLIGAVLEQAKLAEFLALADELGLDCLTEVHDEAELEKVLHCNAKIIGINNRNLKTFQVDLGITQRLIRQIPKDKIIVSESGIFTNKDMKTLGEWGANAVLIGEALMKSENITKAMQTLREDV